MTSSQFLHCFVLRSAWLYHSTRWRQLAPILVLPWVIIYGPKSRELSLLTACGLDESLTPNYYHGTYRTKCGIFPGKTVISYLYIKHIQFTLSEMIAHSTVYLHLSDCWAVITQLDYWLRWWYTVEWAVSSESVLSQALISYLNYDLKLSLSIFWKHFEVEICNTDIEDSNKMFSCFSCMNVCMLWTEGLMKNLLTPTYTQMITETNTLINLHAIWEEREASYHLT